ncbi:unnamed protein product [Staurois parvus]|uniref:Uncharacterized protein n=1 Tax=Staurois parvus TaxID=386267 RepID=A0ABN9BX79_9NEOB|nr:unnamed protein product [Staurois parvus]
MTFLNFQISRRCLYVPTSQGPKHRSRMPASAGDGRGHCRGDIAAAKDKVSSAVNP